MKTRNGFVSNSSSSSFVIITTPENWKKSCAAFKKKVDNNIAEIIFAEYGEGKETTVDGKKLLVFQGVISSEEFGSDAVRKLFKKGKISEDQEENLAIDAYEHLGTFDELLRANGAYCGRGYY